MVQNFRLIEIFSSAMSSQSNEDNFQTFAVARKENLGAKNDTGKFRVFC